MSFEVNNGHDAAASLGAALDTILKHARERPQDKAACLVASAILQLAERVEALRLTMEAAWELEKGEG